MAAGLSADVLINLLGDSKSLDRATGQGGKGLDKMDKSTGKADKSLGKLAARAATFAAGSVAFGAIAGFVNKGIEMADTADLVRKSWDKTFGESSKQLTANITDTAHALGLADFEAQKLLLNTGQLAKAIGLTDDEAADFSEQLFIMAGDVAAFTGNLDDAPGVMAAFESALKGEFDALEQYGVKLKQADIQQRALIDSGKESVQQLTAAELAAATTALIVDQLGDEYGALAEASAEGATDVNRAQADVKEGQEGIGQSFQEVKRLADQSLATVFRLLTSFGEKIADVILWFRKLRDNSNPVISTIADLLQGLIFWLSGAKGGMQELVAAVDRFKDTLRGIPSSLPNPFRNFKMPTIRFPKIPGFATGGTVPGPRGAPMLATVHGGERISTAGSSGGGGDGVTINVSTGVLASPQETAQAIVDLLQTYNRNNGAIAITTRNSDGIV